MPVLSRQDVSELESFGVKLERSTPLFDYVLKEAELMEQGCADPVGGRIVAEVLIGLLQTDPASFAVAQPGWQPRSRTREPASARSTSSASRASTRPVAVSRTSGRADERTSGR